MEQIDALESDAPMDDAGLLESDVRSYCRTFPVVFSRGEGVFLYDVHDRRWHDFLSGAGALNYGHNPPAPKRALLDYIAANGVVSSLDLATAAKRDFLRAFSDVILRPRSLDYKVQFCGPTGANAVEAALKLACKATGRSGIVAFTNSYHGMSAGAMSVTASFRRRKEQYLNPAWVQFFPFDGFTGQPYELEMMHSMLTGRGSGIAAPAAILVEPVQGEGGVNVASAAWLRGLRELATELGAVLIFDEIQAGCGRTGRFFAFEHSDVRPDIVCLSKSISGMGLPMSLLLIDPAMDVWSPGEHNGTFRGFNYAFVTASAMLRHYWGDSGFQRRLDARCTQLRAILDGWRRDLPEKITRISVQGLFAGLQLRSADHAKAVQQDCFEQGLIVELCGPLADTIKLLPPIVIDEPELVSGLRKLMNALARHG